MFAICTEVEGATWPVECVTSDGRDGARCIALAPYVCRITDGVAADFDPSAIDTTYTYHTARGVFLAPDGSCIREAIPAIPPAPVPDITPVQLRIWLRMNKSVNRTDVENMLAAMPGTDIERANAIDTWEYATVIHRENPLISAIGGALGMTYKDIDEAFRAAAQL